MSFTKFEKFSLIIFHSFSCLDVSFWDSPVGMLRLLKLFHRSQKLFLFLSSFFLLSFFLDWTLSVDLS